MREAVRMAGAGSDAGADAAPPPLLLPCPAAPSGLVLTCEHASAAVPPAYRSLGLPRQILHEHIAWDIGAWELTAVLARRLGAPAVGAPVSRLVVDCNRAPEDADLIVAHVHGTDVPGNVGLSPAERRDRIARYYAPYHDAVDRLLAGTPCRLLLSVHSFTPVLNGEERRLDVGVLFDAHEAAARRLAGGLAAAGLRVRDNEPYSAFDGLIHSARTHGRRHGLPYLEIEVNNRLLRDPASVARMGAVIAGALQEVLESPCASS